MNENVNSFETSQAPLQKWSIQGKQHPKFWNNRIEYIEYRASSEMSYFQ